MLTPLHTPNDGALRVVGLLSGSGSNLRALLNRQRELALRLGRAPYEFVGIFSDNAQSQALAIGRDFDLPVLVRDKRAYYAARKTPLRDLALRAEYDAETVRMLAPLGAKAAAYAGYMSIATKPLIEAFLGINVHPADLSIRNADGSRRYTGDHAVRDAIKDGAQTLRSTTHLICPEVDGGGLLMISPAVPIELPCGAPNNDEDAKRAEAHNQARLKERGDWLVFPKTLEDLALGLFSRDEHGLLHHDGLPIPDGLRL